MATKNAKDNYPAAALRHFHDAEILKNVHSYENAFCHYAFSVECAQKLYSIGIITARRPNLE